MNEYPIFFENRAGRKLFGVLHAPETTATSGAGVVFIHALEPEHEDGYRAHTQFSRYLARAGLASFRFDRCGFGDSEGELTDTTIESQLADIADAISYFCDAARIRRCVLLGVRFGATLAALMAGADERVAALGLIAPVVSGADYWNEQLRAAQLAALSQGRKGPNRQAALDELALSGYVELYANRYSKALIEQINAVDLVEPAATLARRRLPMALGPERAGAPRYEALLDAYRRFELDFVEWPPLEREFWTSRSLYDGYLPTGCYERAAAWLAGLSL